MTSQESRQKVLHFKGEKSLREDNAQWTVDSLDPSMQVGFEDANEIKFNARDAAGHPHNPFWMLNLKYSITFLFIVADPLHSLVYVWK